MEKLTIGIPIYNEGEYLSETLYSLLSQNMEEWIGIISDNCSTDESYNIAKKISDKDKRIKVYRHGVKVSALDNFLFTLNQASSKYFVWLGGHDLFDKEYLKNAVDILDKSGSISMVYPRSLFIDINNNQLYPADSDISSNGLSRCDRMCKVALKLSCCTAIHGVFRRNILLKSPFKKVIGSDQLIIFSAASYGELYELPFIGINRRIVREESYQDRKNRWEKDGIIDLKDNVNPQAYLAVEHLIFIFKSRHIYLYEKIYLIVCIIKIFRKRFNVTLKEIFASLQRKIK